MIHNYTKDRIAVVITGDFDENSLAVLVQEKTKDIKEAKEPLIDQIPQPVRLTNPIEVVEKRSTGGSALCRIGWIGVEMLNKDYIPLYLLGYILSGGISARLDQKIVKTGLASSISFGISPEKAPGVFYFYFITDPANVDTIKNIMFGEIEDIKKAHITDEELLRIKRLIKSSFERSRETPYNLANTLGYYWTVANLNFYDTFIDKINKVEKIDIITAAYKYINSDNYASLTFLPEE